jgi:hypothetical protein
MKARLKNVHRAATRPPHGPSLYHLFEVLGKDRVLARMAKALGQF